MGTCSQAQCTHNFKRDLQVGTVRGAGQVEALPLVLRKHSPDSRCHAADQEGLEGGSRGADRPGCPAPTTQYSCCFSDARVRPDRPATPQNGSLWLAEAYLAVRGADRKPNVGGDHHGEGRGQLNSEATVWGGTGRQRHRSSLCGLADTPWLQKSCQNIL